MNRKITAEIEKEILETYKNSGLNFKQLAESFGFASETIAKIIRTKDPDYQLPFTFKDIPEETATEMIKKYKEFGVTLTSLSRDYNIGLTPVRTLFQKRGIKFKSLSESGRTYEINESYFDTIDNQDKAYILGLLITDGCHYKDKIRLVLQERDKKILEDINSLIHINKPIYFRKTNDRWQDQWVLDINNQHIADQLNKWGIVPNKTFKTEFPYWMNEELIPHYLRGVVDGDGHVDRICVIYGNPLFITQIQEYLKEKLKINPRLEERQNILGLLFRREESSIFLKWIYQDANLYIERKFQKYQENISDFKTHVIMDEEERKIRKQRNSRKSSITQILRSETLDGNLTEEHNNLLKTLSENEYHFLRDPYINLKDDGTFETKEERRLKAKKLKNEKRSLLRKKQQMS